MCDKTWKCVLSGVLNLDKASLYKLNHNVLPFLWNLQETRLLHSRLFTEESNGNILWSCFFLFTNTSHSHTSCDSLSLFSHYQCQLCSTSAQISPLSISGRHHNSTYTLGQCSSLSSALVSTYMCMYICTWQSW